MDPLTLSLISLAPSLVKWISGNDTAEKVTTVAVDLAKTVAGVEDATTAIDNIKADPKLAAEFADKLEERKAELEKAYLADTADARGMNVHIQEAASASDLAKNAAYYLDFIVVGATVSLATLCYFKGVPTENKELVYMTLGALLAHCGTIIGFHRGTSSGSKKANDLIHDMAVSK